MPTAEEYSALAQDWVDAYEGDAGAIQRLNSHYERVFAHADVKAEIWRRVYAFRQRSSRVPTNFLQLSEGQLLLAQDAGFGSWDALMAAVASGAGLGPAYDIHEAESKAAPRRRMSRAEWDRFVDEIRERRIRSVHASGLLSDAVIGRLAALDHVTELKLGGSRELTDEGLLQLARMPQLERLNLSEYPGGVLTDRGLEVLRHLPALREFEMTWQAGITDAGVANLRFCENLERVDLMGSPTGDGAVEALQGKPKLRRFASGRKVTDAGLPFLQNYPVYRDAEGDGGSLLLDGPFTDDGLASVAGLAGIRDLDLFWHVRGITPAGFAHLVQLPRLESLGCDGELSSDAAMVHIGAMPSLRRLRIQETVATDDGFVSLSRSRSLESIWGRECPNLGDRGFLALSRLPNLRGLGVGLSKVSDAALAALAEFPELRELTPIGLKDPGFVHVGRCRKLERLTCMYCRETTDAATEQITGLGLRYYYAGLTQITDRSLELLGRIETLEQVDLYECGGVTDGGLVHLVKLPRLREVNLDGLPNVTLEGTRVFPAHVRLRHAN